MNRGILSWAEIDLNAITFNVKALQRHVGRAVEIIAVVKANAYGHGAVAVARTAVEAGATRLAVHRAIEGIELRQAGITAPILIMGYTPPDGAELIARWKLTPSLTTSESALALSAQAISLGASIPVHIKVDTGMSRYGLMPSELVDFLQELNNFPGLQIEGLFTHFATADWADTNFTLQQLQVFNDVLRAAQGSGLHIPIVHAANSAATLNLPQAHFNAVRLGIALYGLQPSSEWPSPIEIRPALTLKSRVSRVRQLPAGAGVSYGRTFVTQHPTIAALIPVGYGDGYPRALSNRSSVLIRGRRAPIIGRVCMDQFVVDVSNIPGVQLDDEVVLIGVQGNENIQAEKLAELAGTINYEITTSLLPRIPRLYIRAG